MNPSTARGTDPVRVAVLLCGHLGTTAGGVSVAAVRGGLEGAGTGVQVSVAEDVCHQPRPIVPFLRASGAARLVLGLCSRGFAAPELQAEVRKAALDPLGVEVVDLGKYASRVHLRPDATAKAQVLLAAAVARARAFTESRPENLKPLLPAAVSRRALLSISFLEYEAVPAVAGERCRAGAGCRRCVDACPYGALDFVDGEIRLEKSRCVSCGTCITTCPHEAIDRPGWTAVQVEAYVGALLGAFPGQLVPRAVLIICRHGAKALEVLAERSACYPAHWLPLEVPSLGMVPATWLLAFLNLGASAAGVVSCPEGCGVTPTGRVEDGVDFSREALRQAGDDPERIALFPQEPSALLAALRTTEMKPLQTPLPPATENFFAHRSRGRVLAVLGERLGVSSLVVDHPASPFGVVDVDAGCTLCGACAAACSPGALRLGSDGDATLTFDPALCIACRRCLPACPEPDVLSLRRTADLSALSRGRQILVEAGYTRCVACGGPIAPQPMLERISALLGDEGTATMRIVGRYCSDCRGLGQ